MPSDYDRGLEAGQAADTPLRGYVIVPETVDFKIGYVLGYADMEGFRNASYLAFVVAAESLIRDYGLDYKAVLKHMNEGDAKDELRRTFEEDDEEDYLEDEE